MAIELAIDLGFSPSEVVIVELFLIYNKFLLESFRVMARKIFNRDIRINKLRILRKEIGFKVIVEEFVLESRKLHLFFLQLL